MLGILELSGSFRAIGILCFIVVKSYLCFFFFSKLQRIVW